MPETWTLTPIASNTKELEALMYGLGGSTCHIRPHERRADLRGVFDLLVEERTNRECQEILERMERVGLRRITEEEQRIISAEIILPGLQHPPLLPPTLPLALHTMDNDEEAIQRLEGEGGVVRE